MLSLILMKTGMTQIALMILMSLGGLQDVLAMGPNITDTLYAKFKEHLHELIESLGPDDYLLVIDGHAFP